jgi:hypothetical protein
VTTNPLLSNDLDTTTKEVGDFSVPLEDKGNFQRIPRRRAAPPMTDIEQVRAALEEIGKGIDLIECSGNAAKQNIAVIKLIWPALKRALAALARMEPPLIRAAALEEAAKILEGDKRWTRWRPAPGPRIQDDIAAALRALKEQP